MSVLDPNREWAQQLVAYLVAIGIEHVGLAAGSRSTPLVLAFSDHPDIRMQAFIDERAMGFCMMAHAKAAQRPTAVLTTSGTAVANLFPAIIEAAETGVPLVVITADRPLDAIGTGANQTIDQRAIFGVYTPYTWDVPCPPDPIPTDWMRPFDACRTVLFGAKPAPVHLNVRFDKPLVDYDTLSESAYKKTPDLSPITPPQCALSHVFQDTISICQNTQSGVILVGAVSPDSIDSILAFANHLQWPIIADIQSHIRFLDHPLVLSAGTALLTEDPICEVIDTCIQFGDKWVHEPLLHRLNHHVKNWLFVHPWITAVDPVNGHTLQVPCSANRFVSTILSELIPSPQNHPILRAHASFLSQRPDIDDHAWDDTACARTLAHHFPEDHVLFCGNSLPIRMLNTVTSSRHPYRIQTYANRGASGIDGLIASAVGISAGARRPVIAVIGDLSCVHDLNSFHLLSSASTPVMIIIVNNHGGGIFHHLPIHKYPKLPDYFTLSHTLSFEHAAAMFDLPYYSASSATDLSTILSECLPLTRSMVVECDVELPNSSQPRILSVS